MVPVVRTAWTSADAAGAWASADAITSRATSMTSELCYFRHSGGTTNGTDGTRRVDPGEVRRVARGHDRGRQAADDRQDAAARRAGGHAGRPGPLPAGTVLRAVLLRRAEDALVRAHRGDPQWSDDEAVPGSREASRDSRRAADLRGREHRRLLQHRG